MSTEALEGLFSTSLDMARKKIDSGLFFNPFILSIKKNAEYLFTECEEDSEDLSQFINDFISLFVSDDELEAFAFIQLTRVRVDEEDIDMDAISVHFETKEGKAISATQIFGKGEDDQWLFAEIDAQETQPILIK